LEELAELPPDETFYVYSVDRSGRIVIGEARHSRMTRRSAQLVELIFDDGSSVRCTPDHRFMLREGTWKEAQYLTIDDSLLAGYFDTVPLRGTRCDYLRVLQPVTGAYEFVHQLADEHNEARRLARRMQGPYVRHHKNFNRFDNRPSNVERLTWQEHNRLHAEHMRQLNADPRFRANRKRRASESSRLMWQDERKRGQIRDAHVKAMADPTLRSFLSEHAIALWEDPNYRAKYAADHHQRMAIALWSDPSVRDEHRAKLLRQWTDSEFRAAHMRGRQKDWNNRRAQNPLAMHVLAARSAQVLTQLWRDPGYRRQVMRTKVAGYVARLMAEFGRDGITPDLYNQQRRQNWIPSCAKALAYFDSFDELLSVAALHNHRVVSMRWLDEPADVYDITVDEHHNFMLANGCVVHNSLDSDPPAAFRYTEMRLHAIAEAHMADIRKETVPFGMSYKQDPRVLEPVYLPGRVPPVCFPNQGIAVGQTSVIPPHNLAEVLKACIALLDGRDLTIDELMRIVRGPDFPTGGTIVGMDGIRDYLETGKGQITIRGEARLEQTPRGQRLVITEVPFPATMKPDKAKLVDSIRDAVNAGKVTGVSDLRDESDQDHGVRVVLELKGAEPARVLNQLYRHTLLQVNVNAVMTFVFGESWEQARHARQAGMLELLKYWIKHQLDVLTRRSRYELRVAKERLHVVEGLIIGAANAQEIVRIFQQSRDRAAAKAVIIKQYKLSEIQANVIADMTLSQVTKLNAAQYKEERLELQRRIKELEALLKDPAMMRELLKDEMRQLISDFGDERRTRVDRGGDKTVEVEEVAHIQEARPILLSLSGGSIRALPIDGYLGRRKLPASNGRTGKEDGNPLLAPGLTTDFVLLLTSQGRVTMLPARNVPDGGRGSEGESIRRFIPMQGDEGIRALLPVSDFAEDRYLVVFTRDGRAKKTPLSEYRAVTASGLNDLKLLGDDDVVAAIETDGRGDYLMLASNGKALRFSDEDLRAAGRVGQGVQAMNLAAGARVVAAAAVHPDDRRAVLLVSSDGFGKRTRLSEFPLKGRATGGVESMVLARGATLAGAAVVDPNDQAVLTSFGGQVMVLTAKDVPLQGRPTRGARLMTFAKADDRVATVVSLSGNGPSHGNGAEPTKPSPSAPPAKPAKPARDPSARPARTSKASGAKAPARATSAPKARPSAAKPPAKGAAQSRKPTPSAGSGNATQQALPLPTAKAKTAQKATPVAPPSARTRSASPAKPPTRNAGNSTRASGRNAEVFDELELFRGS
jgi:DNA gyrase subunit A